MSSKIKRKADKERKRKEKRKKKKVDFSRQKNLYNLLWELEGTLHDSSSAPRKIEICKKILKINENHLFALDILVGHYWNNENLDEAYIYLKRLADGPNPSPDNFFYLGEYYFTRNRYEESIAAYKHFLKLSGKKTNHEIVERKKRVRSQVTLLKRIIKEKSRWPVAPEAAASIPKVKEQSKTLQPDLFDKAENAAFQNGIGSEAEKQKEQTPEGETQALRSQTKNQTIDVVVTVNDKDFIQLIVKQTTNNILFYEKRLEFFHLRLLKDYDELLCLDSLPNISKYWYQIETVKKVLRDFKGRVLLADEVGLGKTIEACMGLKEFMMRGLVKKVLILTPSSLVSQWKEELTTKFDLNFITTEDVNPKNNPDFWKKNSLIIASINTAKSKHNFERVTEVEYDLVIVDEAHHLKNRATVSWKLVNSLKKKFIFMLSATPVQNNLIELFNLITLLKPGVLKTEAEFKKQYVKRGDPKVALNKEKLKDLLREVMIRNTRSLIDIKLPKRFAVTIAVTPSDIEREIYTKINEYISGAVHGKSTVSKMLLTTLLREAGSSPFALRDTLSRRQDQHPSLKAILKLVNEVKETEKGTGLMRLLNKEEGKKIIFTQFKNTLNYLSDLLDRYNVPYSVFHGSLTADRKNRAINTFREEVPILLTTETGGEGRNIQFANTIINYDLPWNPMRLEQRIGRIHRIGQTRDVFIFNFCLKDSIEDFILDILDKKINMFELVIGEIDGILGHVEEDAEFSDIVFDMWSKSSKSDEVKNSFIELGEKMVSARKSYQETKALDEALFEEDFVS